MGPVIVVGGAHQLRMQILARQIFECNATRELPRVGS